MYIEREIKSTFLKLTPIYQSIAIVGPRQAGKTTFLKESSKNLNSKYLLFDDPDIRSIFEKDIKMFETQYMQTSEVYIFDEIQNAKDPGQKLKYLIDSGKKIWITSSSEVILSKEVLSFLVGRVSILRLYPLSLQESLNFRGQLSSTEDIIRRIIAENATYGGYPNVVITPDLETKKIILKDLYETMILKDIAKTFNIEDINSLESLSRYFAINNGSIVSYEKISKDLKISFQTVKKYLMGMEKSYMLRLVPPFYKNSTKEITKQPKLYFIDMGIRNAIINTFNLEISGKNFEAYVFSELLKMGFSPRYWRTKSGAEVDFLIEKDGEIIPIEVKLASNHKIERGLLTFIKEYAPKRAFVIFFEGESYSQTLGDCKVEFVGLHSLSTKL